MSGLKLLAGFAACLSAGCSGQPPPVAVAGGGKAAVPVGWVEHRAKDGRFKGYFPIEPVSNGYQLVDQTLPRLDPATRSYAVTNDVDEVNIGVVVVPFPPDSTAARRTQTLDAILGQLFRLPQGSPPAKQVGETVVTWLGQTAKEMVYEVPNPGSRTAVSVVRQVVAGDVGVVAQVVGRTRRPRPVLVSGFFDNFELLK